MDIPKIIHQIWIGPNKKPTMWMDTWKNDYMNKHNEYTYIEWNEENITDTLNKYPKIKHMYECETEWCGKADLLRYIILFEYGGIYIDADSVWVNGKSLTPLIDLATNTGIFAGIEPDKEWIANGVIGCTKSNTNMKTIIEKLEEIYVIYYKLRKRKGVSKVTGPLFFSKCVQDKITILPSVYFYPVTWHGITDKNLHEKIKIPIESYMFQYGYTTNNFKNIL